MWSLYVVVCREPDHYYVGISQSVNTRVMQHYSGTGAKFTERHGVYGFSVVQEGIEEKKEALKLEKETVLALRSGVQGTVCGAGWSSEIPAFLKYKAQAKVVTPKWKKWVQY